MVGKSLKDKRQQKAIEELFDKADFNRNGRISVHEYAKIFREHGVVLNDEEIGKASSLANGCSL